MPSNKQQKQHIEQQNSTLNQNRHENSISEDYIGGIKMALQEIEASSKKISQGQGMSKITVFFGIINLIVSAFVFGWAPEYYWLVYIVKAIFIIPLRVYTGIPDRSNFYLTDFCWISVFCSSICFSLIVNQLLEVEMAKTAMRIIFMFANGPQGWSAIIFNNALVLHSFSHYCSVFIHLSPVLASYSMRWNYREIHQIFPDIFPKGTTVTSDQFFQEMFLPAFKIYLIWWVIYAAWMCFHGIHLPAKKYQDTVFNWLYTGNPFVKKHLDNIAFKVLGQQRNKQTKSKIMIYMIFHMGMVSCKLLWAYLCYFYQPIHFFFIMLICCAIIWQAAGFYVYFTVQAPIKTLEKLLAKYEKEK